MEESVLKSTKKLMGFNPDDTSFDQDVITFINTAFVRLKELGLVSTAGVTIEDDSAEWADLFEDHGDLAAIKTYVFLRVKLLLDPPGTSYHIAAAKEQREELEYCLLREREIRQWMAPSSSPFPL